MAPHLPSHQSSLSIYLIIVALILIGVSSTIMDVELLSEVTKSWSGSTNVR